LQVVAAYVTFLTTIPYSMKEMKRESESERERGRDKEGEICAYAALMSLCLKNAQHLLI